MHEPTLVKTSKRVPLVLSNAAPLPTLLLHGPGEGQDMDPAEKSAVINAAALQGADGTTPAGLIDSSILPLKEVACHILFATLRLKGCLLCWGLRHCAH